MVVLAIDTTSAHGSLALQRDERLLELREVQAPQSFSRVLFGEIATLLARHAISLPDIDLYAAAAGPGSFTGVRVGLTAAKGLAAAHGKRVAAFSNLLATALLAPPGPRILVPVLDARRGEFYAGVYERRLQASDFPLQEEAPSLNPEVRSLRLLAPEMVVPPAALAERLAALQLPPDDTAFCGPDVERLWSAGVPPAPGCAARFPRLVTGRALAGAIAFLALEAHRSGATLAPEEADANYVRRSDAEIFSKPK
jgi:tRNA threonylcarbamoyladenosine biosynthesis protein TsaB